MKTPPFKPEAKAFAEQWSAALQAIEVQLRRPMEPRTLLSLSEDSRPAERKVKSPTKLLEWQFCDCQYLLSTE